MMTEEIIGVNFILRFVQYPDGTEYYDRLIPADNMEKASALYGVYPDLLPYKIVSSHQLIRTLQ